MDNIKTLTSSHGTKLAYSHQKGEGPGIIFLPGFKSDMEGSKAEALAEHCAQEGIQFTRFDYFAHGKSEGDFLDYTMSHALADTLSILDEVAAGTQILVGSSMGGWVMLLAALARKERVGGIIGIAPAPDFTERLMYAEFTPEMREELEREGVVYVPSDYGYDDYAITQKLIEDGRQHLLMDHPIPLEIPVALLHGQKDEDVPWELSMEIAQRINSPQVKLQLVKDGDHRLSRPEDIVMLIQTTKLIRDLTSGALAL